MEPVRSAAGSRVSETPPVFIGVDVGQKVDPTAIVVVEALPRVSETRSERTKEPYNDGVFYHEAEYSPVVETVYEVRVMRRLPLGEPIRHRKRIVSVDETGVGRPVYEMIKAEIESREFSRGVRIWPISFTHGEKYENGRLGKAYLVSRLQALAQARPPCIKLPPKHAEGEAMMRELADYEIRIDAATANDTYGAFRVGSHDDLVTALGLAVLDDPKAYRTTLAKLPGW